MGNIGFRLVVVIIGNEILNRIIGEEFTELRAKLRCKGLVMSQHQCGAVGFGDDVRHGEGLAAAGNTQKHLFIQSGFQSGRQKLDGLRLIAGGTVVGYKLKTIH